MTRLGGAEEISYGMAMYRKLPQAIAHEKDLHRAFWSVAMLRG
jgi:hypothetical protein